MNDLAVPTLQGIELFSGVGMLGEGLRAGFDYMGISYRPVCHVEREAHAASVLVARMEEGSVDAAPIWSDVTTFNARQWRGKVDCVVAGFPCQDLSVAGRRAGLDGARSGLFFEVVRIADDCGAWLLFLENVAGIASATASVMDPEEGELDERAAARVLGELADLGWNAEWLTLSASDVGGSHRRARWFCIAWRNVADTEHDAGCTEQRPESGRRERKGPPQNSEHRDCYFPMADTARHVGDGAGDRQGGCRRGVCETSDAMDDAMCPERRPGGISGPGCQQGNDEERRQADSGIEIADEALGDTQCDGWGTRRLPYREHDRNVIDSAGQDNRITGVGQADSSSQRRQGSEFGGACAGDGRRQEAHGSVGELCGLFAPGPADPRWAAIIDRHPELAPAIEPTFRRLVNGLAFDMGDSRAARLKCVGNGVVALCAAVASVVLLQLSGIA